MAFDPAMLSSELSTHSSLCQAYFPHPSHPVLLTRITPFLPDFNEEDASPWKPFLKLHPLVSAP